MWAMGVFGFQRHLFAAFEVPNIVNVQRARVGGENEGLRREGVDDCGRIDATI